MAPRPKVITERSCEQCGAILSRRRFPSGLEPPCLYMKRRFCDNRCSARFRSSRVADLRARVPRIRTVGKAPLGSMRCCPRCGASVTVTAAMIRKRWYACVRCVRAAGRKSYWDTRAHRLEYLRARRSTAGFLTWENRYKRALPEELVFRKKARRAANHAVQRGHLQKTPCERCGGADVEAHHDDYAKPLAVRWLCARCHGRQHWKVSA